MPLPVWMSSFIIKNPTISLILLQTGSVIIITEVWFFIRNKIVNFIDSHRSEKNLTEEFYPTQRRRKKIKTFRLPTIK